MALPPDEQDTLPPDEQARVLPKNLLPKNFLKFCEKDYTFCRKYGKIEQCVISSVCTGIGNRIKRSKTGCAKAAQYSFAVMKA